jgi:hypothetical protein
MTNSLQYEATTELIQSFWVHQDKDDRMHGAGFGERYVRASQNLLSTDPVVGYVFH